MNKTADLNPMRHSTAHLLAAAVQKLWLDTKFAIGPAIENGFYYDFEFPETISEQDLPKIEAEMGKIKKDNFPLEQFELTVEDALEKTKGQPYKQELIRDLEKDGGKTVSFYKLGEFEDLCAGPHVENTSQIGYFKLLSIAGAYWRGEEKNKMLTRIYGTVFPTKEELDKHLWQLEEAEARNHRKLGRELELFAIYDQIGQGLPVWLPKGFVIRRILEDYMLALERKFGYQHIITPVLSKDALFQTSGHLGFFNESMYPPIETEGEKLYLKPMSCPGAMLVYGSKPRSYRDLPLKMGEFGLVHRFEKSGELHGLQRVRAFTQNDAHVFLREDQLDEQFSEVIQILKIFYKDVGFAKYWFRLSLSDPKDPKYSIAPAREWKRVETALKKVLDENKLEYETKVGEAAFYGPKLDVQAVNVFGKEDTISTVQADFNQPRRFKLAYIDSSGEEKMPLVIHRALIGSFERFFAFLIEHFGGAFPLWLSPVQVKILPITDDQKDYADKINKKLLNEDIRSEVDGEAATLQNKIRNAQVQKVPYMIIVGKKEQEADNISVRARDGAQENAVSPESFVKRVKRQIEEKTIS